MNQHSTQTSDSPGHFNCPLEDDLALLLESPSARAASANFFSSHLGTLDPNAVNGAYDIFRNGSLGSPDFTKHLNMAGLFDNHQPLSPIAAAIQQTPLHSPRGLQPEMVLQQPGEQQHLENQAKPASMPSMVQQLLSQAQQNNGHHQPQQQQGSTLALAAAVPMPTTTAGPGIAAVAPVPPVQRPAAVVQQAVELKPSPPQQSLLDSNNQPRGLPVLRPLQIPAASAEVYAPVRAGLSSLAGHTCHLQQHKPQTPQQLGPKRQQEQQQHPEPPLKRQRQQLLDPQGATPDQRSAQLGSDVWSAGTADQWLAAVDGAVDVKLTPVNKVAGANVPAAPVAAALCQPGTLVWAKFPRFPWWPGMVISPTADMPSPTTSSSKSPVLVRFLGTHDASWVDPEKAISAWGTNQTERSTKTKAAAFVSALKEANAYANTGVLPDAFSSPPQISVAPPPATKSKAKPVKQPSAVKAPSRAPSPAPPALAAPTAHKPQDHPQQPMMPAADIWSFVTTPPTASGAAAAAALVQNAAAGLMVPTTAAGTHPTSDAAQSSPAAVDPVAQAGPKAGGPSSSSSSRQHKSHRGAASATQAPAGPAAGLRSTGKRKGSERYRSRSSKRGNHETQY